MRSIQIEVEAQARNLDLDSLFRIFHPIIEWDAEAGIRLFNRR